MIALESSTALVPVLPESEFDEPTPAGVIDAKRYHEDGVDPETGLVKAHKPPNSKLSGVAKIRVVELIVAGYRDQEVADRIVQEGLVLSYSDKAVRWWRRRPEVMQALADRTSQAFQAGLGARAMRTTELDKMTRALINHNFRRQGDGYAFVPEADPKAKAAQAQIIAQIRENIKEIGTLVGDNDPVKIHVEGSIRHDRGALVLGFAEKSDDEFEEMLKQALGRIGEEPAQLPPSPVNAIEGVFTVEEAAVPQG